MSAEPLFREDQPLAWLYHRNTCRWIFNTLDTGDELHSPEAGKEYPAAPTTTLPDTALGTLGSLLERRASCRAFSADPITLEQLAGVLGAAYGVVGTSQLGVLELVERTVPSGGGLYPLELYAIVTSVAGVEPGVYHYLPVAGLLEQVREGAVPRSLLSYLFMGQDYIARSAAIVVTTAVWSRSLQKYGDRGYRYLLFEAGHVAQNIDLAAVECGLGACNLGGFFDDELAALLTVDVEHEMPLYATAVGKPDGSTKAAQRAIELPAVSG